MKASTRPRKSLAGDFRLARKTYPMVFTGARVGLKHPDIDRIALIQSSVLKIKQDLIHKAKIKKSYAKLKAREPLVDTQTFPAATAEVSQELHPERQAMLEDPRERTPSPKPTADRTRQSRDRRRSQRPAYYDKEITFAGKKKAETEEKRLEFERREKEKNEKIAEREKYRKAMAKARTGGRNGQRKLGRESKVLLERVKRIVGE